MGEAGVTLGHATLRMPFGQAVEFWHGRPSARLAWSGAPGPEGASIGVCIGGVGSGMLFCCTSGGELWWGALARIAVAQICASSGAWQFSGCADAQYKVHGVVVAPSVTFMVLSTKVAPTQKRAKLVRPHLPTWPVL